MNDVAAPAVSAALDQIRALLGERLSTAIAVREQHGKDQTYHPERRRTRSASRARPRR